MVMELYLFPATAFSNTGVRWERTLSSQLRAKLKKLLTMVLLTGCESDDRSQNLT